VPGMPMKYRATTNPYGPGHSWVKRRWKLPHRGMASRIMRDTPSAKVPNPLPRIAILGRLQENRLLLHAQPDYMAKLVASAAGNEAKLRAWTQGDWNIVAGGMFADSWDEYNVLPAFPFHLIPRGWRIDRAYDHGQSRPFSVGWYAESDGNPIQWGDYEIGPIKGDVIRIAEWYGAANEPPNTGLNMLTRDIAQGIKDREADWNLTGRVRPGPADSQIFARHEGQNSVGRDFSSAGIQWVPCTKGPGSRVHGWAHVNEMLAAATPVNSVREHPGFFVTTRNVKFLELFPSTVRDQKNMDDVDSDTEDHLQDEVRYRLFSGRKTAKRRTF
jgi:hypothetical protein